MKKVILGVFALLTLALTGCKKEEMENVSFESPTPMVTEGVAAVNIVSSYAGTEAVHVPVVFGGTAVKGTDYTVSAESFVLGGASPVTTIKVTPLVYGSKKTVTMALEMPSGFQAGNFPSIAFTLADKLGYLSFEKGKAGMSESLDIKVTLVDGNGSPKRVASQTEVAIELDKEKSSAVEGVNFEFVDGAKVVFAAGESTAQFSIKLKEYEEGKDEIVLNLPENPKFSDGQYISTKVRILGGVEALLGGKWKVTQIYPDKDMVVNSWGADPDKLGGYPVFDAADAFELDFVDKKFKPAFKSALKNYFIGESGMEKLDDSWYPVDRKTGEVDHTMQLTNNIGDIQIVNRYMFDNINRNIDAAKKSEDKEGVVGLTVVENKDKSISLILTLMDYLPTGYEHPAVEWGMFAPDPMFCGKGKEKPVACYTEQMFVISCEKLKAE